MKKIPTRKTATVTLSIDPETRARLTAHSLERHWSISQLVTEWIWSVELEAERTDKEAG